MAVASKALFDMVHRNSAKSFVFGDYCSSVTKPLAESMSFFKLWQVRLMICINNNDITRIKTYFDYVNYNNHKLDSIISILEFYSNTQ